MMKYTLLLHNYHMCDENIGVKKISIVWSKIKKHKFKFNACRRLSRSLDRIHCKLQS